MTFLQPLITSLITLIKNRRASTRFLARKYGSQKISGVEVGVFEGANAVQLLRSLPGLSLRLVDPYALSDGYNEYSSWTTKDQLLAAKTVASQALRPFTRRITWEYTTSIRAAAATPHASLDFVYIDGSHEYDHVLADLRAWWPTLKDGGVLLGHDWDLPSVAHAVLTFTTEQHLHLTIFTPIIGFPEWCIKKTTTT